MPATLSGNSFVQIGLIKGGVGIFYSNTKELNVKRERKQYKHGIPEGYVGVATLKERLGKSATTIWKMTLDGRLPKPLKDGKRNVWDKLEIERWIKNGKFLIMPD